jgi:acetoin utilization deacetylase AcuC-like enzyme
MKIIFNEKLLHASCSDDAASSLDRIQAIHKNFKAEGRKLIKPYSVSEYDLLLAHSQRYIDEIKVNQLKMEIAGIAAGAALMAGELAFNGSPGFACCVPPGHHAGPDSSWGYCVFSNMAISLLKLKKMGKIKSAFVLDIDAHTGDGTQLCLANWPECNILNPYASDSKSFIKIIKDKIKDIQQVDIIGVCAGFDNYEKDVGKLLTTMDFYQIGRLMKQFSERVAQGRRFAVLEGGYYLPDLGKNISAFCQGFG